MEISSRRCVEEISCYVSCASLWRSSLVRDGYGLDGPPGASSIWPVRGPAETLVERYAAPVTLSRMIDAHVAPKSKAVLPFRGARRPGRVLHDFLTRPRRNADDGLAGLTRKPSLANVLSGVSFEDFAGWRRHAGGKTKS